MIADVWHVDNVKNTTALDKNVKKEKFELNLNESKQDAELSLAESEVRCGNRH